MKTKEKSIQAHAPKEFRPRRSDRTLKQWQQQQQQHMQQSYKSGGNT
jgi:hypothetical protein